LISPCPVPDICAERYLPLFLLIIGCLGTYGKFKRQSESESKVTKRELIDNWSDYDIWLIYHPGHKPPRLIAIIFDMKNDGKKILVQEGNRKMVKVKDQQMWMEVVKEHTTSDGEFVLVWGQWQNTESTGVQEIWGPDNQLYGFTIYQEHAVVLQRAELVDKNTIQLSGQPPKRVGK
jgi:hypothetical protein